MRRNVVILGSTGSIGESALDVLSGMADEFRVWGLSAHRRVDKLAEQVRRYDPERVVLSCASDEQPSAAAALAGLNGRLRLGSPALTELATEPAVDVVLSAIVGAAGLEPTLAAVAAGKRVAIANKEPLVMAGHLFTETARRSGAAILPVDSEHSAIFQCLRSGRPDEVRRVILTASGGPFRQTPLAELASVTVEQALRHPNWRMGPKITIDSATMFNKALEVIEARWLFGLRPEQIEVVIHPESIIHSLVEFADGSIIAQLGPPDMRTPIQYALTHPYRRMGRVPPLDLAGLGRMRFEPPDPARFPALELGFRVARLAGTSGAVLNAANEVAVAAFLAGRLRFVQIAEVVAEVLAAHTVEPEPDLAGCRAADAWARREAESCIRQSSRLYRVKAVTSKLPDNTHPS